MCRARTCVLVRADVVVAWGACGCMQVGVQARMMSQGLRKITGNASKCGCTVIFLNQIRYKARPEPTSVQLTAVHCNIKSCRVALTHALLQYPTCFSALERDDHVRKALRPPAVGTGDMTWDAHIPSWPATTTCCSFNP